MGQTQYIAAASVVDCFSIQHLRCIVMLLTFVSKVISTLSGMWKVCLWGWTIALIVHMAYIVSAVKGTYVYLDSWLDLYDLLLY